jgi:hypothetical protein
MAELGHFADKRLVVAPTPDPVADVHFGLLSVQACRRDRR